MPYRTPPEVEQRKAAMRANILAVAAHLFATQGYEATTMQQIVAAAGTSIGNLYFYFPDKAALLMALGEAISADVDARVDVVISRVPPGPAQLVAAIITGVETFLERRDLARIAFIEANQPAFRTAFLAHFTLRVQRVFERAPQLTGGVDPALLAHAWQGANIHVLEGVLQGRIEGDARSIGCFLARWNLQALGIASVVVQQAIDAFEALERSDDHGADREATR